MKHGVHDGGILLDISGWVAVIDDAAVFLYSDIERNDTKNFREKKILRVALSGSGVY